MPQALGLTSGSTLAAGMAADNVAMAAYFSIIMAIPDDAKPEPEDLNCEGTSVWCTAGTMSALTINSVFVIRISCK